MPGVAAYGPNGPEERYYRFLACLELIKAVVWIAVTVLGGGGPFSLL